jgi:hypothetical protein
MTRKITREQRIQSYANAWFWKKVIEPEIIKNNLKYEEIVFVEELNYLHDYSGIVRVTDHLNTTRFIQLHVMFDRVGRPSTLLVGELYKNRDDAVEGGKIIFSL